MGYGVASSVDVMRALAIAAAVAGMTELGCGLNGSGDGAPTDGGVLATGDDAGSFGLGTPIAAACDEGGTSRPPRLPYPAYAPAYGRLLDHGGDLLKAPRIVTITWSADPNEAKLQAFDDALGASSYWKEAMAPYGVGPSRSDASLHVSLKTAPPATMKDADIVPFLVSSITAA